MLLLALIMRSLFCHIMLSCCVIFAYSWEIYEFPACVTDQIQCYRFDIELAYPDQPLLKAKQLFVMDNLLRKKKLSGIFYL